jgi:uncharacterized protein YbjT (DUF2867 family)
MATVVIVGATGLIGSHLAAHVAREGNHVVGVARHMADAERRQPTVRWVRLDLATANQADWTAILNGADAVVNCAGALQDSRLDDLSAIHNTGLRVLVSACEAAGIRRFVHFSAMGVDQGALTPFSSTKSAGEAALIGSGLEWVILRPSVVLGSAVYGASALIRGLAALPLLPVMPDTGPLRPVALEDVVETAAAALGDGAPARLALDLSGPDTFTFTALVGQYRRWLGFAPARTLPVPRWLAHLAYRLGDLVARLGWRPPLRSTARIEIARGAAASNEAWRAAMRMEPRAIPTMLAVRPASVQERWFAGLYLLKPVILVSLAMYWVGSGLASLGPGYDVGIGLLRQGGVETLAPLLVVGGGLADLLVGVGIAVRRMAKAALLAGLAVSLAYAAAGTVATPWLWLDPLAALLKIAPVMALHGVALATLGDR